MENETDFEKTVKRAWNCRAASRCGYACLARVLCLMLVLCSLWRAAHAGLALITMCLTWSSTPSHMWKTNYQHVCLLFRNNAHELVGLHMWAVEICIATQLNCSLFFMRPTFCLLMHECGDFSHIWPVLKHGPRSLTHVQTCGCHFVCAMNVIARIFCYSS